MSGTEGSGTEALDIAVILPCYNEAAAIADVVEDFRRALPGATIYVYDNNSSDDTAAVAAAAGAEVRHEPMQGKGNVVRRAFADVEADVYVMADGDGTYDAERAGALVALLRERQLDMVVGTRHDDSPEAYRRGHRFGNRMFNKVIAWLFDDRFTDVLSGYRVFSRRFVKSFPALSAGFEIEPELTVHAIQLRMPVAEMPTMYSSRAEGTESKLRTYRDGLRILIAIGRFIQRVRPLLFYGVIAIVLALVSVSLGYPVFVEFMETGLVPRFPTVVLATGIMVLAALSLAIALILNANSRSQLEMKRLKYLEYPLMPRR
jgi:glycosyltransferase involved in cell wall biosynthesis